MYIHSKHYQTGGLPAPQAQGALLLLHGRGGTAQNILTLARELNVPKMALYAPQATNNSWYPYSFMAPEQDNQPALDSALEMVDEVVQQIITDGIPADKIYLTGFSQGACLTLEYMARNARRFGGAVAFTGGLIGEQLQPSRYQGDFAGTPILMNTSNPDPHVPIKRVEESVTILQQLGADVKLEVYAGKPHTITMPEIDLANHFVFNNRN